MKLKVKRDVIISKLELFEGVCQKELEAAEREVKSGAWRARLGAELMELAEEVRTDEEMTPEMLDHALYNLRSLNRAEKVAYNVAQAQKTLDLIGRRKALLAASEIDTITVEDDDRFWIKVLQA